VIAADLWRRTPIERMSAYENMRITDPSETKRFEQSVGRWAPVDLLLGELAPKSLNLSGASSRCTILVRYARKARVKRAAAYADAL
jgi:hypothetical protein